MSGENNPGNTILELKKQLARYRFVVEKVVAGVIITDEKSIVLEYNDAASEMEKIPVQDAIGRTTSQLYTRPNNNIKSRFLLAMESKEPIKDDFINYSTSENVAVRIVQSYYPIIYNGQVIGSCSILNEIDKLQNVIDEIKKIKKQALDHVSKSNKEISSNIIGISTKMRTAVDEGMNVAKSDADALIIGETGTGKELLVNLIHNNSKNCNEPFVPINCATIPETLMESILFGTRKGAFTDAKDTTGLFEIAGSGTIFLDELNSMDITCQTKLLRAVQEKKIRKVGSEKEIHIACRIIAAVNKDPWECIKNGTLREDLFYRLSIACIEMPPLRERLEDLQPLISYFITENNEKYNKNVERINDELYKIFNRYSWPGNVRELKNLLESMFILCGNESVLTSNHLPGVYLDKLKDLTSIDESMIPDGKLEDVLFEVERQILIKALRKNNGNKAAAARELGISAQNMQYKVNKFKIQ
ncbi:MAG: sigma 54-interacting transcriptional regulator [Eubacteriaceae bacterium]|jgi:arginine utilization regulatory protein|nr:sigma 54-interacting transcriptional regulator [Eubacteriaceae bacterium]